MNTSPFNGFKNVWRSLYSRPVIGSSMNRGERQKFLKNLNKVDENILIILINLFQMFRSISLQYLR